MKVDAGIGHKLDKIPSIVTKLEADGYDGVRTAEMNHDPFFRYCLQQSTVKTSRSPPLSQWLLRVAP